jgi:hypothetical protein
MSSNDVFARGTCGHEFRYPAGVVIPPHVNCSACGHRVAIWAHSNRPAPTNLSVEEVIDLTTDILEALQGVRERNPSQFNSEPPQ